jgi:DNA uptake protein ComE-like DNA-binding protein
MNASSTRRSESTGYVHAVSRMVVDAAGMTTIRVLMNADTRRFVRRTRRPQAGGNNRGFTHMSTRRVLVTSAVLALVSVPAFAQGMQPTVPAHPAPSAAAPKPSTTGAATHPVAAKLNLNTATVAELDKAPQIGPTRSKAIVEARAKEKFKNWDDFVARKVVPADAAAAMKDVVSF